MRLSHALALSALSLLCLSAFRCSTPLSGGSRPSVSIVAYNVKSLFDAVDDGTEFREFSVSKGSWDDARYKIRLANVAAAVLAAAPEGESPPGPDVLCLEEIENEKVLEALRTGALASARYRYAAIASAEGGPFSVCALSRLPILASSCHSVTTPAGRAGRDILELKLDAGGGRRLIIFSCHWKSKLGGDELTEEARRESAALLRGIIAARLSTEGGEGIVVCGDFNESPDEYDRVGRSYATAFMPVAFASPEARVSSAMREGRILVASRAEEAKPVEGEVVLYSPWEESGGYSYSFRGKRERIDGFLLSPGLLGGGGLVYKRFAPASSAFLMDEKGDPIAWPGSGSTGYSDHLPILLELEVAPGKDS
jgi:endonuclease/exonuclease/phosphatase family metal-dependent hydrolase